MQSVPAFSAERGSSVPRQLPRFRVWSLGLGFWSLGFRVLEFRVQGSGV